MIISIISRYKTPQLLGTILVAPDGHIALAATVSGSIQHVTGISADNLVISRAYILQIKVLIDAIILMVNNYICTLVKNILAK